MVQTDFAKNRKENYNGCTFKRKKFVNTDGFNS